VATLEHCRGRKRETAQLLGVSLKTLYNRLNQYQSSMQHEIGTGPDPYATSPRESVFQIHNL